MCGICGFYGFEDRLLLKKMCNSLTHRGPDEEGYYSDENISLGHRRLSIIDLYTGHQPIFNEDNTVCIIFNGEIYNYQNLKTVLEERHRFSTKTDTEVIVHLYEELGLNFLNKLHGMYALALWDKQNGNLILARDPIGKKPLYYSENEFILYFASEIKALLAGEVKKEIDYQSLCAYLAYAYVPGEKTLFTGIKKLLPGHFLIKEKGKGCKTYKYWDIKENIEQHSDQYYISTLRMLLERSAYYRTISDVPIGAFLSGGIDSSAVVALTKPLVDYDYHTFSVGFETFSELNFANLVANHLDTVPHDIIITPNDVLKNISKIAWQYDEPLGDPAIVNNYFLSKEASKYVKVVVAGEGGDELFAGYSNYKFNKHFYPYFKVPIIPRLIRNVSDIFLNSGDVTRNWFSRFLMKFVQENFVKFHQYSTRMMTDEEIQWLLKMQCERIDSQLILPHNISDPLNIMLALDCKNLLPEKYLMKADKATMANSVEERLPLLDKSIIEYSFTLPSHIKQRKGIEKYVLKMAVKDLLPKEIIMRKKQGFGTPIQDWISIGDLSEIIEQTIMENPIIREYFVPEKLLKLISQKNNNAHVLRYIWTLFALGLWYDVYFN
jgi:asparagine synthase (glutamine-hydrolysing)